MANSNVLYIGADHDVEYLGASVARTGTYLNSGMCAWELFDGANVLVSSGVLSYDVGSNGDYYGVIQSTVTGTLLLDAPYVVEITFSDSGYDDERVIPVRAAYRKLT
jgi:hypothetical protein